MGLTAMTRTKMSSIHDNSYGEQVIWISLPEGIPAECYGDD